MTTQTQNTKVKSKKNILFALLLSLTTLFLFFAAAFLQKKSETIYEEVIRLHVIAHSNDETDQKIKLLVRDALLENAGVVFSGKNIDEAVAQSKASPDLLAKIAEKTLDENGADYGARVFFGKEAYPERVYDKKVYPAGQYLSLRVVLGAGDGENWWCVLFPPLCLGASAYIVAPARGAAKGAAQSVQTDGVKVRFKFKILEYFR